MERLRAVVSYADQGVTVGTAARETEYGDRFDKIRQNQASGAV
ncbi:hypothetical protein F441_07524 [Phytophthora nicotianae CJ01A1]|uniref:Uncharacterized protein n=4 Tax=Phytophthora nicotianae TaxID=4792 RepID=V9FAE9_PHYNI|nr:hypothetical protein F443_07550 [Phytophthora nicotianae P1569]ETK88368.1 hypothetical protein L915_07366 [Phytophthora nicotianae]ETO77212.1 hypothetical protein F444_07558 [Phytophthora nicotianae P1976]ETP18222.1 hypothetical protein F441_07524 [Phytophthora nicotianae CJ01A1]ETL41768.1 hypothetical protein L916_07313 [Phytophthora nicotianae]